MQSVRPPSRSISDSSGSLSASTSYTRDLSRKHRTLLCKEKISDETKPNEAVSRRRAPLACEMCRRRKRKCDAESSTQTCSLCRQRQTRCVFRVPDRSNASASEDELKRAKYIADLEKRVEQMETLLYKAGMLPQDYMDDASRVNEDYADKDRKDSQAKRQNSGVFKSLQHGSHQTTSGDGPRDNSSSLATSPKSTKKPFKRPQASDSSSARGGGSSIRSATTPITPQSETFLTDGEYVDALTPSSLFIANIDKESRCYNRTSIHPIMSQAGLQWIRERTGEQDIFQSFQQPSTTGCPWTFWRPDVFHDLFSCPVYKSLPPRPEVFALLKSYFGNINRIYPIFHEETYMQMVEWQYTQQTCDDVTRWASINVLLALGMRYPVNTPKHEKDIERSWLYFKNAIAVLTEITLRCANILVPQTLLALALFIRGHCGITATLSLSSAALRACHSLGCHKRAYRPDLSPVEQEQRRRVFWVAYFFDQSLAMQAGIPSMQNYQDFDVDLPNVDPFEGSVLVPDGPSWGISFFRTICHQTVIRGKIYKRLYSSKSFSMSLEELQISVDELNAEMETWKAQNSFWRPVNELDPDAPGLEMHAQVGAHIYFNHSHIMINRIPLIYESFHLSVRDTQRRCPPLEKLSPIVQKANSVCVQAARNILKLIDVMPWGEIGILRYYTDYLFLAVMVLATSCVRDPQGAATMKDPDILNKATVYFNTIAPQDGRCKPAKYMATCTAIFEKTVRKICEKNRKDRHRDKKEREARLKDGDKSVKVPEKPVANTRQYEDDRPPAAAKGSEDSVAGELEAPKQDIPFNVSSLPLETPSGPVNHQEQLLALPDSGITMENSIFTPSIPQSQLQPPLPQLDSSTYYAAPWFYADNMSCLSLDGATLPAEVLQFPVPNRWELMDSIPGNPVQGKLTGLNANSVSDIINNALHAPNTIYQAPGFPQPSLVQPFSTKRPKH